MTKQELAGFVIKLIGVYALVQSLPQLQSIGMFFGGLNVDGELSNNFWLYAGLILPFIIMFSVGIILIIFGRTFGGMLFRKESNQTINSSVRIEELQAIGFSVVAILIVLQVIPRLGQLLTNIWALARNDFVDRNLVRTTWQTGIIFFVQFSLALLLFLRAKGLAHFWHKIQSSRTKDAEPAD